ncbi:4701_t:CDS:2 [Diversispora eburnea]|uniref:4701_t:CDS:1 n=1 Tax=Diversispora eburnea TaxID=1213867 RepID=A0A9N8YJL1_9GLOM|nr:4701_t:CDS:2 [Diversispora eburnea]
MPFGIEKVLYRGAKRYQMTSKKGHNYYKGTGSGAMGRHTSRGGYIIDLRKVRTYVVPDLSNCEYKPYVTPEAKRGIKFSLNTNEYLNILRRELYPTETIYDTVKTGERSRKRFNPPNEEANQQEEVTAEEQSRLF